MKKVLDYLIDCYVKNKPFDHTKCLTTDLNKFLDAHRISLGSLDLKNKSEIFDFVNDNELLFSKQGNLDIKIRCQFKNLAIAFQHQAWQIAGGEEPELSKVVDYIIKNKVKFNEFVRYTMKDGLYETGRKILPFSKIKFDDVLYHFNEHFQCWHTEYSIDAGAALVRLCDYFGIKVKPLDKTPADWSVEEFEFEEFADSAENKKKLKEFARLFSKPMNQWYSKKWCEIQDKQNDY